MTEEPTTRELIVDLLKAYRNWVALGLLLVGGLVAAVSLGAVGWTWTGLPSLPLWAIVGIVGLLGSALGGALVGSLTARLMPDTLDHILVALGQTEDSEFQIWGMNNPAWDDLDTDGDVHEYPTASGGWRAHEILAYDDDEHRAEASWKGAVSQRAMAQNEAKIDYNARVLERKAQLGEYVYMNRGQLLRDGLRQYTRKLNDALEGATLPGTRELEAVFDEVANGLEDRTEVDERDPGRVSRSEADAATAAGSTSTAAATDGGKNGEE